MSTKTDQRVVSEMRAFAQGATKKPLPPKQHVFEEDEYVADVSVKQKPKSRVVYVEDITPDEPVNNNNAQHSAPANNPTANAAVGSTNKEGKRQGNGNNSHKPPQSKSYKTNESHSTKKDKPKGDLGKRKEPLAVPTKKLPATSDAPKCVSKISNLIRNDLDEKNIFFELNFTGKQKMSPEPFYRKLGNTIYTSLLEFLNIERYADGNDPATGRQMWGFNLPTMHKDIPHIGTWYFLDRAYHHNSVSWETNAELIEKYRRVFQDHDGIDIEWLENLRNALKEKFFNLPNSGLNVIIDTVRETWCSNCEREPEETVDAAVLQAPASTAGYAADDDDTDGDDGCGEQLRLEDALDPLYNDDGEDGDEDEDEDENKLNIELERYEGLDMLTILPRNLQPITFYTDLEQIDPEEYIPSLVSDSNGIWDWLMHFVPNMIFRTMEPEKYISETPEPVADTKIIILDEIDGLYTMGIYYVDPDFGNELLDDGSDDLNHRELIMKVNNIVRREMGSSFTSHRTITLGLERLFWDEEDILEYIGVYQDVKDGLLKSGSDEESETSDAFNDAVNKAASIASGEVPVEEEKGVEVEADDDTSPDPEDDPPYPGDDSEDPDGEEVDYNHDDSSDFMFTPVSKKNKYSS